MAWSDVLTLTLLFGLGISLAVGRLRALSKEELRLGCRLHAWDTKKPPRCIRCGWLAGTETPQDVGIEGP